MFEICTKLFSSNKLSEKKYTFLHGYFMGEGNETFLKSFPISMTRFCRCIHVWHFSISKLIGRCDIQNILFPTSLLCFIGIVRFEIIYKEYRKDSFFCFILFLFVSTVVDQKN